MTAPLALSHAFQYLAPGLLGKIDVDNGKIRAWGRYSIYRLDKRDCGFSVRDHNEFTFNAMFFKGPSNESRIRGIILGKKNGDRLRAKRRAAGLRRSGP